MFQCVLIAKEEFLQGTKHVRSLLFSSVSIASPFVPNEGILKEMVETKWLSKSTESECLRRKLTAESLGSPLTVHVNLTQEHADN